MDPLEGTTWPISRLGEALLELAQRSNLPISAKEPPGPPSRQTRRGEGDLPRRIQAAAIGLGLAAEPYEASYADLAKALAFAAPAVLLIPESGHTSDDERRFFVLLTSRADKASLIGPDRRVQRLPIDAVRSALWAEDESPLVEEIDRVFRQAGVPLRRRDRSQRAILRERLAYLPAVGIWHLRSREGLSLGQNLRRARLPLQLTTLGSVHAARYLLWLIAWWAIGQITLVGRADRRLWYAWAFLLIASVPLGWLQTWVEGMIAIRIGSVLKRQLLAGALSLDPEEIRHQGVGQLLGRVLESEAMEMMALGGGIKGVVATIELLASAFVLATGAGGWLQVVSLLLWVAFILIMARRYHRRALEATDARLTMTHDLVERMVGHRTRLAQEPRSHWHNGEDQLLDQYLNRQRAADSIGAALVPLAWRGWLLVGALGLVPAFTRATADVTALAVGVGGVLLAGRALLRLSNGLWEIVGALIASRQAKPLLEAARRALPHEFRPSDLHPGDLRADVFEGQPLLSAEHLDFRYRTTGEPVLKGCTLRIHPGDRILLVGPSGGGKSTFASLLAGLRQPEAGKLLWGVGERDAIAPEDLRRHVVLAPQFHENHVLTETFAFNLLMGRRWPPRLEELAEAERLCRDLGLGDLLERMPAGMMQLVGETGWQLSHGERSRLYIARALLQGAHLIVLDESFASLDPESLRQTLSTVIRRATTLLVIAHP